MPRIKLLLPVFMLLLGFSSPASAAFPFFGSKETVRVLAPTGIPAADGSNFNLGRKLTFRAFLLPYVIEDGGYVLVQASDPKKYSPLPTGHKLATLQANGYLPNPLPPLKLKFADYLVGYALWWLLLAVIVVHQTIVRRAAREEARELGGEDF